MPMKFNLRPIFKDVSLTFFAQVIILVAFIFIYRLIARNFGADGIGEYSLVKKVIAFLQPLFLLGLGVGIPRYIAMSQDKNQISAYMKAGGSMVTIFTFILIIFINLFKDYFAKLFFGSIEYTNLVLPFSLLFAGLVLHALIVFCFRGKLLIKTFNSLQIINLAIVPIGILIIFKNITIERLIILIGVTTLIITFLFSLLLVKEFFIWIEKRQLKNSLKELFCYSFPRFIASFVYGGLMSLGPIFAAQFASIQEVGYLSVSQSLLGTVGVVSAPLGLILLPKVSNMITQKREGEIKENLNYLIGAVIQCSVFLCFQLIIFTDAIIKYWLGPDFIGAIPVMRIIFCSIVFFLFCGAVGSVLEASKVKPINLINLCISLGIFLIIAGILLFLVKFFSPIISLSIGFTSGLTCLGILTYFSIRKIYPEKLRKDLNYLWIAIGINISLGGVAMLAKPFIVSRFYYLAIFEILIGVVYLSILWLLKIEWLKKIPQKILLK